MQSAQPNPFYLCLGCFQLVVGNEPTRENEQKTFPYNLDGACDREQIIKAAEKLHPPLTPNEHFFTYLPEGPTLEPGEGSNSKKGLRRRRQKQYEIVRIHEELKEMNHGHTCQQVQQDYDESDREPDLRIVPPVPYEPYRHRYKKQGLEWKNRLDHVREQESERVSEFEDEAGSPESGAIKVILKEEPRATCYCDETLFEEKMIRCSSVSCLYGWIHLRCSDLAEISQASENYVCPRCRICAAEQTESTLEVGTIRRSSSVDMSEGYEASISGNEQSSDDDQLDQDDADDDQHVPQVSAWVAINM